LRTTSSVEVGDHVSGADAHLVGRRALHGRDDRDLAHPLLDLDPEAEEGALLLFAHRRVLVGLEKGRVRIEPREHAVDGGIDELLRGNRLGGPLAQGRQDVGVFVERRNLALRRGEELSSEGAPEERCGAQKRDRHEKAGPWLAHSNLLTRKTRGAWTF
jgi:hypothetical protein